MKSSRDVHVQKRRPSLCAQMWAVRPLVTAVQSAGQEELEQWPYLEGPLSFPWWKSFHQKSFTKDWPVIKWTWKHQSAVSLGAVLLRSWTRGHPPTKTHTLSCQLRGSLRFRENLLHHVYLRRFFYAYYFLFILYFLTQTKRVHVKYLEKSLTQRKQSTRGSCSVLTLVFHNRP